MVVERFGQHHIGESDRVCQSQILSAHPPPLAKTDIGILQFDVRNVVVATLDKIQFHSNLLGVFVYDFDLFIQSRVII